MRLRFFTICLSLCFAGLVSAPGRAADPENPYKNAKVGDWALYKSTIEAGGSTVETKVKVKVTAKDDKEVKVESIAIVKDKEFPGQEMKIDLTKPYDPVNANGIPAGAEVKVKKLEDGKETVTIGKTKYECTWVKSKVTTKVKDKEIETEAKVWLSKDAPLSGMVKMEMKNTGANVVTTLEESGKGK